MRLFCRQVICTFFQTCLTLFSYLQYTLCKFDSDSLSAVPLIGLFLVACSDTAVLSRTSNLCRTLVRSSYCTALKFFYIFAMYCMVLRQKKHLAITYYFRNIVPVYERNMLCLYVRYQCKSKSIRRRRRGMGDTKGLGSSNYDRRHKLG